MPLRTARVPQEYAGRDIDAGDHFEVEAEHIDILLLAGLIEPEAAIEKFQTSIGDAQRALDQDLRYMRRDIVAAPKKKPANALKAD